VELVERQRKSAPKEVLMAWAEQWRKEGVAVNWEELLLPKGFQVLPQRWVVERTFSLDRPEQEDEQRLRAVVGDERGVHLRGDESSDGEEIGPLLRLFEWFLETV
jgi:transposase